jgi:predicted AlkP superfamily pyrophosphatase or phosphodiesterase
MRLSDVRGWIALLAALALPAGSAARPPAPATQAVAETRAPVTIFVSIDAFRPDYLHKGNTPNLDALAAGGVQGTMRPSFPSLTFPNHEAMITGLRPDRSGIVAGVMYDPRRPGLKFGNTEATQYDSFWWDAAEPLWVSAENQHIQTGVMFWPGLEIEHDGVRPTDWARYDGNYLGGSRVRTILDWMRRPAGIRPKLAVLYLDIVDKTGHKKGIEGPEIIEAIRQTDGWIGELVAGLKELGQPANLVIVSDHGMTEIRPERTLLLPSILPVDSYRFAQWGPFASIDPTPGHEAQVEAALLAPHPFAKCWRKADLPERYHYGKNPRVTAFVCVAQAGGEIMPVMPTNKGDHGYDPDDPDMTAMLLLNGPAFRTGAAAPPKFDNVDIYPLLRDLIGLPPASDIDGSDAPFHDILVRRQEK